MTSKVVPSLTDFLHGDQLYERNYRLSRFNCSYKRSYKKKEKMNIILNNRRQAKDVRESVRHRKYSTYKLGSNIFLNSTYKS